MLLLNMHLPLDEPVIIIALLLAVLLIGPVLFERLRLPAIAGLLIFGALIGPNGFNLLSPDLEFSLLGTMGLLYLMFLAGLEIDLVDFIENKGKSIFIGLATFVIPFGVGFLVFFYLLDYDFVASWLISAMLSSHTLISYPILNRLGIVNKPIVTVVVGATIIADVLALVFMEIITNFQESGFQVQTLLIIGLQFLVFGAIMLVVVPRVSRIFLRRYEGEMGVQYIYILFILFMSAVVAHLLNIEPILGAFFSGLMLNRLVINSSPLYKRIEFIGNNLFIPFFLISIGVLTNFRLFFEEPSSLISLFILLVAAFSGKYLAAILARIVLRISKTETNLLFGLSLSRAASAIAIILIGFNMGVIPEVVMNNTVMLILISSITSSYITQKSGKKLLFEEENEEEDYDDSIQHKILVPLANPSNMKNLLDFACLVRDDAAVSSIFPLTIITDRDEVRAAINSNKKEIEKTIDRLHSDIPFEVVSRIDNNVTGGIARAAEELDTSIIVLGWNQSHAPFRMLFGSILKNLLRKTERMLMVLKTPSSFESIRKVHLFFHENAQYEKGFHLWIMSLVVLARKLQLRLQVYCSSEQTIEALFHHLEETNASRYFNIVKMESYKERLRSIPDSNSDLVVFIHSRKEAVSYDKSFEHTMNKAAERFQKNNIVIIYPEQ